ncbi:long-chain fatty acid--CoA ligase [Haloarcula sp. CBA1130]|uniref:AMP-binding protein n=1 Tax=unclassified Haloarcula TaxID=2624677 RepID=UPI001246CBCA|nr:MULTISPECIES: AMP-binding protein [unclassified Haloarcula]KAA9397173.1 long-chain fatty acid--CoA ligase [Haloarcula sp. CBA1129]KAA9402791.1 long-chain fatty acid--CoA ligase [Haloarcula sp. CBA1130]
MSEFGPGTPQEWVGAWSERRAALTPTREGLVDATTGERFTYAELDRRANRTARLLRQYGVGTDSDTARTDTAGSVAVVSRNRPAVVDLFFATGKTGSRLAPLSHRLAPPELAALLDRVNPEILVVEAPFADAVSTALETADATAPQLIHLETAADGASSVAELDSTPYASALPEDGSSVETATPAPGDTHLLLHTGGSTGTPKETEITHRGIVWNSLNTITAWGLRADDVTPMVFPLFHTGGWNVLTVPLWHMGGTVVIAREFDPGDVLETIDAEGGTVLVAVPAVLRMMTQHDRWDSTDLSTLRFAKSGGGPCRKSVMETWWDRGVDLSQGYGLTECGPNNFAMPEGWPREKADSVGKPAMHVDARVVEPADAADGDSATGQRKTVDPDTVGELQLRSPHAATGYLDNPEATAETFSDNWVSTGDLARVDADGYYYIEGRTKHMFVSGGENVYPAEVEDAIAAHPSVADVVVIPVPDDRWGHVGKAIIEPAPDVTTEGAGDRPLTLDDLRAFLDDRLARYKHPCEIAFVEAMPTSGPDKIDRGAISDRFGT